jgi:hypothetical protein
MGLSFEGFSAEKGRPSDRLRAGPSAPLRASDV